MSSFFRTRHTRCYGGVPPLSDITNGAFFFGYFSLFPKIWIPPLPLLLIQKKCRRKIRPFTFGEICFQSKIDQLPDLDTTSVVYIFRASRPPPPPPPQNKIRRFSHPVLYMVNSCNRHETIATIDRQSLQRAYTSRNTFCMSVPTIDDIRSVGWLVE